MGAAEAKPFKLMPNQDEPPAFDANYGFEHGRKERAMIATEAEMISSKLDLEYRDYCAHHALEYLACRRRNFPWIIKCKHEKHVYLDCQYDDYVIRMKEFERDRRLRERQARILEKQI